MRKSRNGFYYLVVKRVLGFVLALVLAFPAALIILVCCIAIRLETKGPAFFVQERPGYKGKIFYIYKLRTMIVETQRNGVPLADIERTTKVGRVIRTFSLDELPQLLNILKGDMGFIGPRPLLVSYLSLYTPEQMRRHDVRPGISGWAQVNGRNELSWEQKFASDVWYVENISFGLDVKILLLTIWKVLHRSGINAGDNETMEAFAGIVESEDRFNA